jgi:cobyric acid synthase
MSAKTLMIQGTTSDAGKIAIRNLFIDRYAMLSILRSAGLISDGAFC